jgi:5'-3' exonuclease
VWRKALYEEYKNNRSHVYNRYDDFNVSKQLNRLESAANSVLPHSNIRQYKIDTQEADDLIYAACKMTDKDGIIISSDKDLTQIIWQMDDIQIYDPIKAHFIEKPGCNPVVEKSLVGDKSDNIHGYKGIGPVKARRLMGDIPALREFLNKNGADTFRRNLALIDMSKNPSLDTNIQYVKSVMDSEVDFNKSNIKKLIIENKITGFMSEYHDLITPLQRLI